MFSRISVFQTVDGDWAYTLTVGDQSFTDTGFLLKGYAHKAAVELSRAIYRQEVTSEGSE